MLKNRSHESGRSMVEMVGVLAIMGLVTAGAFVLIQSGMASQKRNRLADEIDILVSNARAMTAGSENCDSLPVTPSTFAKTDTSANLAKSILQMTDNVTPLGGNSYYAISRASGTSVKQFKIHVVGLTADECATLGARSFSGGTASCPSSGTTVTITYNKN